MPSKLLTLEPPFRPFAVSIKVVAEEACGLRLPHFDTTIIEVIAKEETRAGIRAKRAGLLLGSRLVDTVSVEEVIDLVGPWCSISPPTDLPASPEPNLAPKSGAGATSPLGPQPRVGRQPRLIRDGCEAMDTYYDADFTGTTVFAWWDESVPEYRPVLAELMESGLALLFSLADVILLRGAWETTDEADPPWDPTVLKAWGPRGKRLGRSKWIELQRPGR